MAILSSWGVLGFLLLLCVYCARTYDVDYNSDELPQPSLDFKRHAIIKPRFYHGREKREISTTKTKTGNEHFHDLMIEVNIGGDDHILDLRLNRDLLSGTYFQKHQENGQQKVFRPTKEEVELCQYQGDIRGIPKSWVAVSTCNGLRGVIYDGKELHYLEPTFMYRKRNADEDEKLGEIFHYKQSDIHATNHSCGYEGTPEHVLQSEHLSHVNRFKRTPESSNDDSMTEIRGPYNANKKTRYVELVLVVDRKEFVELGSSIENVYQHCKDIANIINALYMPLNIFIALVGVVVWSENDEITLETNGDKTLTNFLQYRRERLVKDHPNDNAQLLTRVQFDNGVVGKALKGPICTYEFSGGVNMDHSNVVGLVATTVAHEMGHNFGMEHDSSDCVCPSERCIMAPSSSTLSPTQWSSCSEKYLLLAFHHGMDYCLHNKPTKLFGSPVCGNGFVEPGEQCDCGLDIRCTNPCCNATTCMLHTNASCATGECCDFETCRPKMAGSVCRSADQECDLPEFCTGKSEYCPVDVFKMDGETCNHGKAFCYKGMCRTRSDQCKLLWGPSGKSSDALCYKMNTKGTRNGNCGYNRLNQSYVKCVDDNIYCGMLHCRHLNERLEFGMESVSILSHAFINAGGLITPCRTAIVDLGLNDVDPGLAPDGSKCGEGKMCVNQKCMAVSSLRAGSVIGSCPQNCNGNGVCNSKGHCHCNPGFAYPFCDYPGTGGSEDSGPASDPNVGRKYVTALYIIFLGIVPFVAMMALLMYYTRPLVKHWWKKPTNMAVNGTRHSMYVNQSSFACCMSLRAWIDSLNCSGLCGYSTQTHKFSFCTHKRFHSPYCLRSKRKPTNISQLKLSSQKASNCDHTKGTQPKNQGNLLVQNHSSISLDEIKAAPLPTVSSIVNSTEKNSLKNIKIMNLQNPASFFLSKKAGEDKVLKFADKKPSKEIIKSELVFTTNTEVMKFIGKDPKLCEGFSTLLNVPVSISDISQTSSKVNDTKEPLQINASENKSDQGFKKLRVHEACPKTPQRLDLSLELNDQAEVSSMNPNPGSRIENNPETDAIQHFQSSESVIVNIHQKERMPKVKSFGVASAKLITEVVEVIPRDSISHQDSANKDRSFRCSFRKKQRILEKLKTKKIKPNTVITTDIYI